MVLSRDKTKATTVMSRIRLTRWIASMIDEVVLQHPGVMDFTTVPPPGVANRVKLTLTTIRVRVTS